MRNWEPRWRPGQPGGSRGPTAASFQNASNRADLDDNNVHLDDHDTQIAGNRASGAGLIDFVLATQVYELDSGVTQTHDILLARQMLYH